LCQLLKIILDNISRTIANKYFLFHLIIIYKIQRNEIKKDVQNTYLFIRVMNGHVAVNLILINCSILLKLLITQSSIHTCSRYNIKWYIISLWIKILISFFISEKHVIKLYKKIYHLSYLEYSLDMTKL